MHASDGKKVTGDTGNNQGNQRSDYIDEVVEIKESFAAKNKGNEHQEDCGIAQMQRPFGKDGKTCKFVIVEISENSRHRNQHRQQITVFVRFGTEDNI